MTYRFTGGEHGAADHADPRRHRLRPAGVRASTMVTTTTTGSRLMVAGDFQRLVIGDRLGLHRRAGAPPLRSREPLPDRAARRPRDLADGSRGRGAERAALLEVRDATRRRRRRRTHKRPTRSDKLRAVETFVADVDGDPMIVHKGEVVT